RLGRRCCDCLLGRVVGCLGELVLELLAANVLRDVETTLVRRLRDRLLPAVADLRHDEQTELLERRRELTEVPITERRKQSHHDPRRQADVGRETTDNLLVARPVRHDRLADLRLRQTVEALALLELETVEADRAPTVALLRLLPAEDREEVGARRLV